MMDDNDRVMAGEKLGDPEAGTVQMPAAPSSQPATDGPVKKSPPPLRRLDALLGPAMKRSDARREKREKPIPLPWPDMLEQFGGGLWPGVHVLVAGTGAGKTAWALQLALHAAQAKTPVGYIGLELEDMQIALRMLGEQTKIPWTDLYLGKVSEVGAARAHAAIDELAGLPFYVETGRPNGWPISELTTFIESMRKLHPETEPGSAPMLLVLDFLQIVGDEERGDGRMMGFDLRERIGRAAYAARHAAKDHNVAVLLISSAARASYALLAGLAGSTKEDKVKPGIRATIDPDNGKPAPKRRPIVLGRYIDNPDALVGLGKESGEIEFSADSVTVAMRAGAPFLSDRARKPVIFATAKGRATGAGWCELRFTGHRFDDSPDGGLEVATRIAGDEPTKKEGAGPTSRNGAADVSVSGADTGD